MNDCSHMSLWQFEKLQWEWMFVHWPLMLAFVVVAAVGVFYVWNHS